MCKVLFFWKACSLAYLWRFSPILLAGFDLGEKFEALLFACFTSSFNGFLLYSLGENIPSLGFLSLTRDCLSPPPNLASFANRPDLLLAGAVTVTLSVLWLVSCLGLFCLWPAADQCLRSSSRKKAPRSGSITLREVYLIPGRSCFVPVMF